MTGIAKFILCSQVNFWIMKSTSCICKNCGIGFSKPTNEYNRRIKFGRELFCSRSCAGKHNLRNFGNRINRVPPPPRFGANPFKYYLRNCQRRDQHCSITIDYLEQLWTTQNGRCPYTGVLLVLNTHANQSHDKRYTASLDRIDCNKGYIPGNVQFVSMPINYLKNTMSHEHTIEFLQIIAKNLSSLS